MILLSANKSSPIRCFSQLSLFHSCYQSFIPPKSQLQQMIWKTEWQTWWDFVGMKLLFVKFPFGTEMRMSQQNHEGGWSGIGMATVGIHPNDFDLYPNKMPPGRVVQNCPGGIINALLNCSILSKKRIRFWFWEERYISVWKLKIHFH